MERKKTVLAVVAHADDLEFMAGGTVARFINEKGYDVYEHILTDNSVGSFRLSKEELIRVSAEEAVEAGRSLGLKDVRLEGYPDAFLNETHPNVIRDKVMSFIREVKADIVMSWDPFASREDHPDHRIVGMATYEAASFAANPLFHPEHPFAPYKCTEAYWFAKHPGDNAQTFVDISSTVDAKIDALLKHDCQMALTVDLVAAEAETLGVDMPGLKDMDADTYRVFIKNAIRDFCAAVGQRAGYAFAEQFRYETLGMLNQLLGDDFYKPEFD